LHRCFSFRSAGCFSEDHGASHRLSPPAAAPENHARLQNISIEFVGFLTDKRGCLGLT
jgi:hypothetical protein